MVKIRKMLVCILSVSVFCGCMTMYAKAEDSNENAVAEQNQDIEQEAEPKEVDTQEEEWLKNNLPDELTGMDENGDVYTLDEEEGNIQENISRRAITAQVVNFNTKGYSGITSYDEVGTGTDGYTCGAYGADAAYLGSRDGKVTFMLSGVIGQVNASEVQVVSCSSVQSLSHYVVSGGRLLHKITTNMNYTSYGSTLDQGDAPAYLKEGQKYYSYDGHYFYSEDNYDVMLYDYNREVRSNAVNPEQPYYNYFQYLPLRSATNYTGGQLNSIINNKVDSSSKMKDIGNILVDMQNRYGAHALIMTGVAANESAWGRSNIARTKNNLFGMNAVDSSPGESANYYSSVEKCIKEFSEIFMSKQYLNPKNWKYFGAFLGNKASGINVEYASDPYWGEKAANVAWNLDRANGDADTGKYTIGIKDTMSNEHTGLRVRKEATTSSVILYNTGSQSCHAFIILGESGNFYKVQSDPVLDGGRTGIESGSGNYDFNTMYAYSSKDYITKVNSGMVHWENEGINTNVSSPQAMYTDVTLSAQIEGSTSGLQYKFVWQKDNWNEWGVIQEFSYSDEAVWTAEAGGNYKLYLDVLDGSGKMETTIIDFEIKNWGITGVSTDLEPPQLKNTDIVISPQVIGDTSSLQYKFVWMKEKWDKWDVMKDFSSVNEVQWSPPEAGEYNLYVDVKDTDGVGATKILPYSIVNKLWIFKGISVDKASPQELGMPVVISADMENVKENLEYKFVWMKDNWDTWGVIQEFSGENSAKWTPDELGEYYIYVDVRDKNGENLEHQNTAYDIIQGNWKTSSIQTNPPELQKLGDEVQIQAKVNGNRTGLQYKFVWQKDDWAEWGVIREFTSADTVIWKPQSIGQYKLYVDVKDLADRMETSIIPYEISSKAWEYEGVETNQSSPQEIGTKINISPMIKGNKEGLEYKFVWMKDNWKQWDVIKDFSESDSASWTPSEPGEYRFYVDVREKGGENLETTWSAFTVVQGTWEISGMSFDLESPQIASTEIEIASRIIGNKTGLKYKFVWMKDDWDSWGVIQGKGDKTKATWCPEETGKYKIYMDVFDNSGKSETYIQEYEIVDWKIVTKPLKAGETGKEVVITTEGIEHNKNLQYKFVWMKNQWEEWDVIQKLSEQKSAKWIPGEAGKYNLYVDVKNIKTGETVTKSIPYDIR